MEFGALENHKSRLNKVMFGFVLFFNKEAHVSQTTSDVRSLKIVQQILATFHCSQIMHIGLTRKSKMSCYVM